MGRSTAGEGRAGRQVNKATERRPFLWLVYKSVRWRERGSGSSSDKVICIVLLIATTTSKANSITPTTNKRKKESDREGEKEMR